MNGSDNIKMAINIGGEIIHLNVKFDEQIGVRDAEREVKLYIDKLRKTREEASDRELLAMAAYQFANWYLQLYKIQQDAIELVNLKSQQIENWDNEVSDLILKTPETQNSGNSLLSY